MKTIITLMLFSFSLYAWAQETELVDGTGFPSHFSKIESGSFQGTINGTLNLITPKGDSLSVNYRSEPALLSIVHDLNEVYDVSFKRYQVQSPGQRVQVDYRTYAFANEFKVLLDGKTYLLGGIDGGCDLVIDGLSYEYSRNQKMEYLLLHFTKDVGLRLEGKGQGAVITIKRGSLMIFDIHK